MAWVVELAKSAEETLDRLDKVAQKRIQRFIRERLIPAADPRQLGKALAGNHAGKWRYRVGDYRLICQIEEARLTLLIIKIGHRSNIY
jgi:mRNA interferase RelE/StbE